MKAVLQDFSNGKMEVADVPPPTLKPGGVLVANVASLISVGTEKALIELSKMNPLQKARARPDLVSKVLSKAGQEGLLATAKIVRNLVSAPLPLGYSCAGIVRAVGAGVSDLQPGMRVACAGLGFANHAEVVFVPRNLCVAIPDTVSFEAASFATVGAIALHGVRQAELTLDETVVVMGLGLVGQLTVQICVASGCRVFAVDTDADKVERAKRLGAEDGCLPGDRLSPAVRTFSRQRGADAVLITASSKSSEPVAVAAEMARDRGRVVVIGDTGMDIPRRPYYEKEIDIRLSRSYGPGRYDPAYEEKGHDYPIGYVRWTENRNMEACLDLIARGRVRADDLVTHRFPIEQAQHAYDALLGETNESVIGILLQYDAGKEQSSRVAFAPAGNKIASADRGGIVRFGVIGAGQFAQGILLPHLKAVPGVVFRSFVTGSGLTSRAVGLRYGALMCTSDYREVIVDPEVDAVLIATRHDLHAPMVAEAIEAGKHVFVEKPLALNEEQLAPVEATYKKAAISGSGAPQLLVGFNRRFSPLALQMKEALAQGRLVMNYRVNASPVPAGHWHQDAEQGGGRIVGEICHFIDVMQYLTSAEPVEVFAMATLDGDRRSADPDNLVINLTFTEGSVGTIAYVSAGDPSYPKERLEVFGGGMVGVIDNWRTLRVQGNGRRVKKRYWLGTEKGHEQEMKLFVSSIRNGHPTIPFSSLLATVRATFAVQRSFREGLPVKVAGLQ